MVGTMANDPGNAIQYKDSPTVLPRWDMKSDDTYDNWAMKIQLAVERITCQNFIGSERPVVGDVGDRTVTLELCCALTAVHRDPSTPKGLHACILSRHLCLSIPKHT